MFCREDQSGIKAAIPRALTLEGNRAGGDGEWPRISSDVYYTYGRNFTNLRMRGTRTLYGTPKHGVSTVRLLEMNIVGERERPNLGFARDVLAA